MSAKQQMIVIEEEDIKKIAREIAAISNTCCYRSDGWEEEMASKFEEMIRKYLEGVDKRRIYPAKIPERWL